MLKLFVHLLLIIAISVGIACTNTQDTEIISVYVISDPAGDVNETTKPNHCDETKIDMTECRISVTDHTCTFEIQLVGNVDIEKHYFEIYMDIDNNTTTGCWNGAEYVIWDYFLLECLKGNESAHVKDMDIPTTINGNNLILTVNLESQLIDGANIYLRSYCRWDEDVQDLTDSIVLSKKY